MRLVILSLIICTAIFCIFPEIDIIVSSLFYNEAGEERFFLRHNFIVEAIYVSVRIFTTIILSICFFVVIYDFLIKKNWRKLFIFPDLAQNIRDKFNLTSRAAAFLLVVIIATPGILVHNVMKPAWQRARPVNIEEFGGVKKFTPIYKPFASQKGKSFPSGHASMGAAMIALAYVVSKSRRRKIFVITSIYAFLASMGRVVQGGHFLSDVTISFILTIITILLADKYILQKTEDNP